MWHRLYNRPSPNFKVGDVVLCPKVGGAKRKVTNYSWDIREETWRYSLRGTLDTFYEHELKKPRGDDIR
jgi:hypothetical protein